MEQDRFTQFGVMWLSDHPVFNINKQIEEWGAAKLTAPRSKIT